MNWMIKNFFESTGNLIDGMLGYLTFAINEIFQAGAAFANEGYIQSACNVTTLMATSLLALVVIKQIYNTYIMETDGDPDSDPLDILERAAISLAMITCHDFIYRQLTTFSDKFFNDLNNSINGTIEKDPIAKLVVTLAEFVSSPIASVIEGVKIVFILFFVVGVIFLCVKGGIRGGQLCFMKILFPLFCCDFVTTKRERWANFSLSYVVTIVGYVFQLFLFRLSAHQFAQFCEMADAFTSLFTSFGFLYLSIKTPEFLKKYVYSSGVGQTVSGGARTAAFSVPSILRYLK